MTRLKLSKAINEGLRKAMEKDPKDLIMGEDVGKLGGVFRVTDGLQKDFGEARVIDTPLAESGIIGTAIGLALRGYRPICEVPFGGGIGAVEHHSEAPESLFAHTPGLRVVSCGDPADAYTMIQQAARSDDPVMFFEPKRRYWEKAEIDIDGGLAAALPMDRARVLVPGTDVTVLCYGPMVRTCAEAAVAASADGRSLEVIDLRSLAPLDTEAIFTSVRKTGRCVIRHEAGVTGGLGG